MYSLVCVTPHNLVKIFCNWFFEYIIVCHMNFLHYLWRINEKLNFIIPFYIPGMKLVSTSLIIARKKK